MLLHEGAAALIHSQKLPLLHGQPGRCSQRLLLLLQSQSSRDDKVFTQVIDAIGGESEGRLEQAGLGLARDRVRGG